MTERSYIHLHKEHKGSPRCKIAIQGVTDISEYNPVSSYNKW